MKTDQKPQKITRRTALKSGALAGVAAGLPRLASRPVGRRILELRFDKSRGAMRAIERVIP